MAYIIILNLRVVFFFFYSIIENFEKVLICYLAIGNIIVYCTIIILNILKKEFDYIKLKVIKD